ncbi:MAG: ADOP family duplicated permease, partial [Acidobacteriota bacterium]
MSDPRAWTRSLMRALLALYPRRFRELFAAELVELHARRQASRQRFEPIREAAALLDILLGAPAAWRNERRRAGRRADPGESWMNNLLHEAGLTIRVLTTRHRAFTALCVLTLAMGLGAATSIFSVINGVLIAPLPYGEPERIVRLYEQPLGEGYGVFSGPNFTDLRQRATSFEIVAAYDDYRAEGIDLTGGARVERLRLLRVGSGYFEALGVAPILGRTLKPSEEIPTNYAELLEGRSREQPVSLAAEMARVVILSHAFWQRQFGGHPDALGSLLELNEQRYEVIGVMPARLGGDLGGAPDVWLPHDLSAGGRNHRGNFYMSAVARLAPGVTVEQAQAELDLVSGQLREEHPQANDHLALHAEPLEESVVGSSRGMLWVLFAAVGAMLAIACINVANLFLARGLGQRRELGVRAALGAGGRRLFAAALLESLWIGLAGGLVGLGVAWLAVSWLHRLRPAALPRFDALAVDPAVFAFSLVAVLLTVLIFGLLPAARAARADIRSAFGDRGGLSAGLRDRRLRDWGVTLQVALSLVLLTSGALLARSFLSLEGTEVGFDAANVHTFQLRLPSYAYGEGERRSDFYGRLFERLEALPEIEASGATSKLPGNGHRNHWGFGIEGREPAEGEGWPSAQMRCVSGSLIESLGVPVLAGRDLAASDTRESAQVVLVNRALTEAFFPNGEALGAQIYIGGGPIPRTIVGVVGDTRHDPRQDPIAKVYIPHAQYANNRNWDLSFVVKTSGGSPSSARLAVDQAVAELDPRLVVYDHRAFSEVVAEPIARQRFSAQLMMIFALLAL